MTAHRDLKRLVRARAQRTGESYTAALHNLRTAQTEPLGASGDLRVRVPAEGRAVLRRYQELLDEQLPGRIAGLYLIGSAALGEFDPREDRLEFVAVTEAPLSEADRVTCNALHHAVRAQVRGPDLNGLYVTRDQLRASPPRDPYQFTAWKDGRLERADIAGYPVSKVNPVTWTILAQHGITLRGPDAHDLRIHQDRTELTAWNLRNLDTFWRNTARTAREMPTEAAAALDARKIPWTILGPPRLHFTISTGRITTKDGGGKYALENFPRQWHGLVRDALAIHRGEALVFSAATKDRLQLTIADFIDFVISDAHNIANN